MFPLHKITSGNVVRRSTLSSGGNFSAKLSTNKLKKMEETKSTKIQTNEAYKPSGCNCKNIYVQRRRNAFFFFPRCCLK